MGGRKIFKLSIGWYEGERLAPLKCLFVRLVVEIH